MLFSEFSVLVEADDGDVVACVRGGWGGGVSSGPPASTFGERLGF